jgi:hypothetical protein
LTCPLQIKTSIEGQRKDKSQSRVPVTALIAWPTFHSEVKQQVANQMAAPAETRTPNMHRANESLLESADGSMATVATRPTKKYVHKKPRIDLTPTGLLMEGHYTSEPQENFLTHGR